MRKMKQNYLLVYQNKWNGEILHRYFETKKDMAEFINIKIYDKKYWKILHKFEVKEI